MVEGQVMVEGADTLAAQRAVCRAARHREPKVQGTGLGGRHHQLGRLQHDGRVAGVPALDGCQRPDAAVFLTDHALDHHGAGQVHAGIAEGARGE